MSASVCSSDLRFVLFVAILSFVACSTNAPEESSSSDALADPSLQASVPSSTSNVPASAPLPLIGYSVPNWWAESTFDATKFADALCTAGLGLTEIEYTLPDGTWNLDAAAAFVTAMRSCSIVTFINVANWNNEIVRGQDDTWFQARVDEIVATIGTDHVILGAVSEPDGSAKTYRWTEYARLVWPGTFVTPGYPHELTLLAEGDFSDWHYCDADRLASDLQTTTADRLFNTDCATILNPGPSASYDLAQQAHGAGNTLNIYDWAAQDPDWTTIDAMGAAIR